MPNNEFAALDARALLSIPVRTAVAMLIVEEPSEHDQSYETAAWYRRHQLKPGSYPVIVGYAYSQNNCERHLRVKVDSTITAAYLGTLYGGVAIGTDTAGAAEVGKDDSYVLTVGRCFYIEGAACNEARTFPPKGARLEWTHPAMLDADSSPTSAQPEKVPGERWTTDRGAMPGEAFAWMDGDHETGRAAMFELADSGSGTSRFEVRVVGGAVIAGAGTIAAAARRAELALPPEA